MRRLSLLLILLLLPTFTGCKKACNVKPQLNNLFFTATACWNGTDYNFSCQTDNSTLNLTVNLPQNCQNYKLSCNSDKIICNYLELEKSFAVSSLPENSVVGILHLAFRHSLNNPTVCFEKDTYFTDFSAESQNYRLYISQSGLPIKIVALNSENALFFNGVTVTK